MKMTAVGLICAIASLVSEPVFGRTYPYTFSETVPLGNVTGPYVTGCIPARSSFPLVTANAWCSTFPPPNYGLFTWEHTYQFVCPYPYLCTAFIYYTGNYGVSGFAKPRYQVVGVYYAPPGAKSVASYSNGFINGTSTSNSSSFTVGASVSLSGTFDITTTDKGPTVQGSITSSWSQEKDTSSSLTIAIQETNGITAPGPASSAVGVDHDYDTIWIWLNPEVDLTIFPGSTIQTNYYAYDPLAPTNGPDIIYLTVGQLKGTQPILADVQTDMQRGWDPAGGPLTAADLAQIMKADVFATNPSFDPNLDTSGRFEWPNGQDIVLPFEVAGPGGQAICQNGSASYSSTSTRGQGATDTYSVDVTVDAKSGNEFSNFFTAELKTTSTYTYVNKWSSVISNGTTQSASFNICGPLATDGYPPNGPAHVQIWKDNIYGTFMFYPEP